MTSTFSHASRATSNTVAAADNLLKPYHHVPLQKKGFPCTMDWCQHRFDTEKEMKRHKYTDPDHFYCKKCDVDCEDWEDLTRHKVDKMAPFIEGSVKLGDEEMPAHIVCEFCGEDFKSFGGRKRHRALTHPAEQEVRCPGCTTIFCRACDMVGHLEKGHCEAISARDFYLSMQQKFINSQMMQAPDLFNKSLGIKTLDSSNFSKSTAEDGCKNQQDRACEEETFDQESGGIGLLDQPDIKTSGMTAFDPEVNVVELTRENLENRSRLGDHETLETWPSLARYHRTKSTTSHLEQSLTELSVGDAASRRASDTLSENDEAASEATTLYSNRMQSPVWSGNASKMLFTEAKPSPQAGDWTAVQQAHEQLVEVDENKNPLKAQWWDPTAPDYKVDAFYNTFIQRYCCPFPECYGGGNDDDDVKGFERNEINGGPTMNITYLSPADLEDHIMTVHLRRVFRCIVCFKRFNSCAALIGHAESTWKCNVRESKGFKKLIEDISGGYLRAKYIGEKKIYRPETALIKKGQPTGGVMSTKYTGKKPYEQ